MKLLNELNQPKWSDLGELRGRDFVEAVLMPLYLYSWLFSGFVVFLNSIYLFIFFSNYKVLIFTTNYFLINPWYLCYFMFIFPWERKDSLKKKILKKLCSCVWMSYMNIMWVQVPLEARRRHWIPWNWRNRQLWAATCGCWELNLCKSSKCSYPLCHFSSLTSFLFHGYAFY